MEETFGGESTKQVADKKRWRMDIDDDNNCNGDHLNLEGEDPGRGNGPGKRYRLSKAGEALMETTQCGSHIEYKTRVEQVTKYNESDYKWTTCLGCLSAVMVTTLPKEVNKDSL